MMKKTSLIMLILIGMVLTSCHKDKEVDAKDPVVSNEELTVYGTQARFEWCVDFSGEFQTGVELSQNENMNDLRRVEATKQEEKYVVVVNGLSMGKRYYYRIVVWNKFNNYEQQVHDFTTKQSYSVTLSCFPEDGGTVTGGGTYTVGDTCVVKAAVNEGYRFVKWMENENIASVEAEFRFAVISDRNLVAYFTSEEFLITATADPDSGGTVSGGGGFHYGEECTLMATASSGYRFVNWTKDDSVVHGEPTYSFPVTESGEYVAHFEEIAFDLDVSAQPTVIAQGGSSQLNAVASGGTGSFSYSWTPNASLNDASIHNPIASPTTTTTYTCTVTSEGQTGSGSCTVKVVCPPTDLTATVQNSNNVHLNWTAAALAESYNVYRDNTMIAQGITNTSYNDNGLGSGTYHYRVSAVYQGVESPKSNEASATIYNSLSVTASANPVTIPDGGSSTLTATASGGDGNYTYSWTPSTGLNNTHTQSPTATPSSTTTYTVTVESNGETASDAVTVNVVKAPTGLAAMVNGNNVHLTWNAANPVSSYKVYRDNTVIASNVISATYTDNGLNVGDYSYQVSAVYQGVESLKSNSAQATIVPQVPVGAIKGKFTINPNKDKVYFSQGNLQYNAAQGTHQCADGSMKSGTWRFATNQWDYVGGNFNGQEYGTVYENGVKCDNALISPTYYGWIDLFGWGTSGWNNGNTYYQPWDTNNTNGSSYGPSGLYDLTGTYANSDWGIYNAISNGGNQAGLWRTLTMEEWKYVMQDRDGNRFAKACIVNGSETIKGVILLPDDWDVNIYDLNSINVGNINFEVNSITSSQWTVLEQAGAVFLPVTGWRLGIVLKEMNNIVGHYWQASSYPETDKAYNTAFAFSYVMYNEYYYRYGGESVRLVCPAE